MIQYLIVEDGTRIAYSADGNGPTLFLVGAPVGRAGFEALAAHLKRRYRVVMHDPRGIGQSTCASTGPVTPQRLAQDLAALIEHLAAHEIVVFGTSGGAVTALELLRLMPDRVAGVIAHEPPVFHLLDDAGKTLAAANNALDKAHDDPRAMQAFADATEVLHHTRHETPRPGAIPLPEPSPEGIARDRFFLTRMAGPTVNYAPDARSLRGSRILVAAGEASVGQPARRASAALASAIGADLVEAPGNHFAASAMPAEFAAWVEKMIEHFIRSPTGTHVNQASYSQANTLLTMRCAVAVDIRAATGIVWQLLTDAEGFARWNSTVTRIEGQIREGERLRIHAPGTKQTFKPRISGVVDGHSMVWSDGIPSLFTGERTFTLSARSDGTTHFAMEERFSGIAFALLRKALPDFRPIFEAYAGDLKCEAERLARGSAA
jgi:pimeloyl-ACP methyl ester carboxylesterase